MSHSVTWKCYRCHQQRIDLLGSKFIFAKEGANYFKRRICPDCVAKGKK